jgi:hypothetical protein
VVAEQSPEACGKLGCLRFASPVAAFEYVLASQPRVLAVGEAHAQKSNPAVESATRRFESQFLPLLAGRASDLIAEIWVANGRCAEEREVEKRQQPVTQPQAETNQNEFVELGRASQALGIAPHVLRPSCQEYARITAAGEGDIEAMLEMIARLTAETVARLDRERPRERLLVTYGGALHNDVEPRPGREAFSFGPELWRVTHGRYVELDLIVPEFIGDGPAWTAVPWVGQYDRARLGNATVLYNPNPGSYVLVFPLSAAAQR